MLIKPGEPATRFASGLDGSFRRIALAVGLAFLSWGDARAESASFRWSPGCAVVFYEEGRIVTHREYAQSEQEASSVCNAKDPIFLFGANALSSCEIAPAASDSSELGPSFEYRISYRISPVRKHSGTDVRDYISTEVIAFCRAKPAEVVTYEPSTVSTSLQDAIRRSPAMNGYEPVADAPWEVFSSKKGASVVLVPVRWWDYDPSGEDPYFDRWSDRVPYVRLVLIQQERRRDARFELVARLDANEELRNVVDIDGDGYPEADFFLDTGDGWEYWVTSLHPGNVDRQTLWFTYRSADWVRVGRGN
jgi:hypothetical protein